MQQSSSLSEAKIEETVKGFTEVYNAAVASKDFDCKCQGVQRVLISETSSPLEIAAIEKLRSGMIWRDTYGPFPIGLKPEVVQEDGKLFFDISFGRA